MHSILFKIGRFELHSYGVLLALAFLTGIYIGIKRGEKEGIDPNIIMNISMLIMISSLIGSRILYVIFHLSEFRGRYLDIINPFQSDGNIGIAGLTMLGGIIAAIITVFFYVMIKKIPFLKIADILSPSVAVGTGITRIGCFFNGCCYGEPTSMPWGMIFPPESPAGYHFYNVHIHPAQLYASLGGFVIFIILLSLVKYKRFDGFIFFCFLILYAIDRFIIDFFRYYEEAMVFFTIGNINISVNQGICIFLFVTGIILIMIYYRKKSIYL